jgi:hypothetical protein
MRGTWASVGAAVLLVAACGSRPHDGAAAKDDHDAAAAQETTTTTAPATTAPPAGPPAVQQIQAIPLALARVADTQMLTAIAWRNADPNPYLADQHGMIYHLVNRRTDSVLDLTAEVLDYRPGAEYGMLGMTFDPVDGRIILGFNGNDVDTRIVSYAVGDDGRPDPASAREILRIQQPGVGHNNGHLAFDARNNLFIAMGDGGGSSGGRRPGHDEALGRAPPDHAEPRRPRVHGPGRQPLRRRPRRRARDLGQGDAQPLAVLRRPRDRRHVDRRRRRVELGGRLQDPPGQKGFNLGWPAYEGSHQTHFNDDVPAPADPVMPVYEYPHDVGPAVIGGYVYRGRAIPGLQGAYVFMDMTGPIWAMGADGVVELDLEAGGVQTSFGEDPDGELWLLTQQNGLFKLGPA